MDDFEQFQVRLSSNIPPRAEQSEERTADARDERIRFARSHQARGFRELIGVRWPGLGADRRPTGALSDQHHLPATTRSRRVSKLRPAILPTRSADDFS